MKKILFMASLFLAIASCKPPKSALEKYDRSALLNNLADSVIVPSYSDFKTRTTALNDAANVFLSNPNAATLSDLQNSWKQSVSAWMHCEVYNFYYAYDNSLSAQIASWPVDQNVIENEIHGTQTLDESYITATGTTRKGLSAVEYLIYGNQRSVQQVLDSFSISSFANRRKQYLNALCAHINTQGQAVFTDWNGGASYQHFTSNTQLDINGSVNLLVNALTSYIEYVRKSKVEKPSGVVTGNPDTTTIENRLAGISIQNIRDNIAAWRDIITGKSGIGLDDYMDNVNAQYNGELLSKAITDELDLCDAKAAAINLPLPEACIQTPADVQALYLELKKLTVLTKVDMASNLGVVITFSDNDGD